MRVPTFVHSELLSPSVRGTQNNELLHVTDWFPTLVNLAGGSTDDLPLDGFDIWSTIK